MEETTKICRVCKRELPMEQFTLTKGGGRKNTCRECQNAARRATIEKNRTAIGGGVFYPFSDSDFDGKQPVEVIQLMSRAKRWLESRGYEITLKGCYNVRKEIKF